MDQEYIEFEDCRLIRQTEKACLVEIPDQGEQWLPWSQVGEDSISKDGDVGFLYLTKWICDQKEIEY